jgi:hypothetical protein
MSDTPKHFILQTLWSQSAGRNLNPGENATLEDLSAEQIEKLTAGNVITPLVKTDSRSAGATTSNPPTAESELAAAVDQAAEFVVPADFTPSTPTVEGGAAG